MMNKIRDTDTETGTRTQPPNEYREAPANPQTLKDIPATASPGPS